MKLLITGPLGHIGSRFIHHLKPGDYSEVVLLDNLSTQRYCSLFDLPQGVPFRFVRGDICTDDLATLFRGMDVVLHLAAITDAATSFEIVDDVDRVNYSGTERVARACMETGSRLVFPSTTSVYGSQSELVDEDCPEEDLKPQSPYAESKLHAERMLRELGPSLNRTLKFVTFRFGTIFGTSIGMRFHTAINKFCWQACAGQPITVWRTALHQKRPYLALGDAIRAIDFAIQHDHFDGQTYNVLSANATVGEIVDEIKAYVPDAQIEYTDARSMNQLSYEVARDKFSALGFEFNGGLSAGIGETIDLIRGMRQKIKER